MSAAQLAKAAHRHNATLAARLAATARRSWVAYWDWRARKATVHILRSLDRRTLKDIGLDPGEIESAVYGKPNDRLRCYRENWTVRSGA